MRSPGQYALARLLSALCGLWAAIAPVAPQIHQSFAKHRHVYCTEHNRIEDEAVDETHDRFTAHASRPEMATISSAAPSTTVGLSGVECLFSNFLAHAVTHTPSRATTRFLSAELPTLIFRGVDLRGIDTYRIAPKTSPPDILRLAGRTGVSVRTFGV